MHATFPEPGTPEHRLVLLAGAGRVLSVSQCAHALGASRTKAQSVVRSLCDHGIFSPQGRGWALVGDLMVQDHGKGHYLCRADSCGYKGRTYCQNCGYAKGERRGKAAFGAVA